MSDETHDPAQTAYAARVARYTVPTMRHISSRSQETERLYRLETANHDAFRRSTTELMRVLNTFGVETRDYFQNAVPESLFSFLESQDSAAALLAALSFIDWYRLNRTEMYAPVLAHYIAHRPIHAIAVQTEETAAAKAIACPACGLPPAEGE